MKTLSWLFTALVAAGCGGTQEGPAHPVDLSRYDDEKFASEELCEHAVANIERTYYMSTTTPKRLFDRVSYTEAHRDRVRKCSITLTEREAACLASAPSLQYVRNCQRFPELQ